MARLDRILNLIRDYFSKQPLLDDEDKKMVDRILEEISIDSISPREGLYLDTELKGTLEYLIHKYGSRLDDSQRNLDIYKGSFQAKASQSLTTKGLKITEYSLHCEMMTDEKFVNYQMDISTYKRFVEYFSELRWILKDRKSSLDRFFEEDKSDN